MKFFSKIFGNNKEKTDINTGKDDQFPFMRDEPENTGLIEALNAWSKKETPENYNAVTEKLNSEETFLFLPSIQDTDDETTDWKNLIDNVDENINSVFEVEGHSVLTVFSDRKSLFDWNMDEIEYTILPSKKVLEFAEKHKVGNIVINSGLLNMFILELHNNTGTEDEIGPVVEKPETLLSEEFTANLISNFEHAGSILEAWQFSQVIDDERNLIVGIRLIHDNEVARTRMIEAVNHTLQTMKPNVAFGVMIMDNTWINLMEEISITPFYSKE